MQALFASFFSCWSAAKSSSDKTSQSFPESEICPDSSSGVSTLKGILRNEGISIVIKEYTNKIGETKYIIGEKSFFQVNKYNKEKLYNNKGDENMGASIKRSNKLFCF